MSTSPFLAMKRDRKSSQKGLLEKLKGENKSSYTKDERLYYPQRDKAGNASVVIRFLPGIKPDESEAYVKTYQHGWQNPKNKKWFIEECPTTLGRDHTCPVCEANSEEYNKGVEVYAKTARHRKRKTQFFSNILVVKDTNNPENEGKVFLFRYGKKIFDMISAAVQPKFEDEKPINVFNPWHGANFKLRITKVDGNTNYDSSIFESPGPVYEDDDKIIEALDQQYDIRSEYLDPKKFKSYDELKKRFDQIERGISTSSAGSTAESDDIETAPSSSGSVEEDPPFDTEDSDDGEISDDPMKWFEEQANKD